MSNVPPPPPGAQHPLPPSVPLRLISATDRQAILTNVIAQELARGGRVESQGPANAVIVHGHKCNHVLHAILTLFTCLWGIVWIIKASSDGEHRAQFFVDDYGQITTQRLS